MIRYFLSAILAISLFGAAAAQVPVTTTSSSIGQAIATGSSSYKSKYKYSYKHKHYKKKKKKRRKDDACHSWNDVKWGYYWKNKKKYWKHKAGYSNDEKCDDPDDPHKITRD
ncbi:MAG: hypothetical protein AAGA89_10075 [Pseudomonadota bacterium]